MLIDPVRARCCWWMMEFWIMLCLINSPNEHISHFTRSLFLFPILSKWIMTLELPQTHNQSFISTFASDVSHADEHVRDYETLLYEWLGPQQFSSNNGKGRKKEFQAEFSLKSFSPYEVDVPMTHILSFKLCILNMFALFLVQGENKECQGAILCKSLKVQPMIGSRTKRTIRKEK